MPVIAENSVNLTPVPYKMTIGEGKLILPQNFEISHAGLPDSIGIETEKFAAHLQKVTGYTITVVPESEKALIKMSLYTGSELIGDEGYTCVDEEGNKLGSFDTYIQAGETYILNIPTYEGYSFKELTGGNKGANIASKNIDIVIIYKNNETGINEVISNKEERIYDLQGRHLKYISHPEIYIVNGKKVLINK